MMKPRGRSSGHRLHAGIVALSLALFLTGFASAGSASTSAKTAQPPATVLPPVITGKAQEGQLLRAAVGRWRLGRNPEFSYQWRLCDSAGGACVDIAKANDRVYALRHGAVGHTLRVVVTAKGGGRGAIASSAATARVSPAPAGAPLNTTRPTVTGPRTRGALLTAQAGTWTGKQPIRLEYRWRSCDEEGGSCQELGRTGQTYMLRDNDVGHALRVLVIAQNALETSAALSGPTLVVTGATQPRATPPAIISPPRIAGRAQQGEMLTASPGTWSGKRPITFTYQWIYCNRESADCGSLTGATSRTYRVGVRDVGGRLIVSVTATNEEGAASAQSNATAVVAARASRPANTSKPTISGSAREGETLTASPGTWSGTQPITFAYQWIRCNPQSADCGSLTGATSRTYRLGAGDVDRRLIVSVTARNEGGASSAQSNATAVVAAQASRATPPSNTSKPTISGTAREGETLTASPGTWSGTQPIAFTYQWIRCNQQSANCGSLTGATSRTYRLGAGDVGRRLIVSVTAKNAEGASSAQSNATAVVAARATRPTNTAKPTISGTAREGERLTASNGSWSGTPPISFSYQWVRCSATVSNCASIAAATNNTYTLTASDVGRRMLVSVAARNAQGATTAQSDATAVVAPRGTAPAATAPPVISGTPKVGQTLTVSNGSWSGTQPITFSYQWLRCDRNGASCSNIVGATGQSYRLTDADVNRTIRATVGAVNQAGSTAATSVPTGVVTPAAPPGPAGQIRLPNGKVSIPVSSVSLPARLVVDRVSFLPNPVRSRRAPITARFRVSDTRGFVVRGALVFVRSVPLRTTTPPEQATRQEGTVSFVVFPRARFPLRTGLNVQFFVRARKPGDNVLAGVSTRRLVQVRTATPR